MVVHNKILEQYHIMRSELILNNGKTYYINMYRYCPDTIPSPIENTSKDDAYNALYDVLNEMVGYNKTNCGFTLNNGNEYRIVMAKNEPNGNARPIKDTTREDVYTALYDILKELGEINGEE